MINLQTRELVLKWKSEGKKQQQIADLIGCNQSAVSRLIAKFKKTGSAKNLPRSGRPTPLTKKTLAKLKAEFVKKTRAAHKNFCSIDVKQFSQIVEKETSKKYTSRHVERILHKLDFSRITPRPQHVKNDPKKVGEFRDEFKKLQTKYVGHELIAIDEAGFQLTTSYKRIWFPRGETPRGAFFWSSKKLITFGALTSDHKFYYDFYDSQNSLTFRHFLRELFKKIEQEKEICAHS